MTRLQVVVVGGGAAGFFAAVNCAQLRPECDVTVLEKSRKLLAKVKISGGGRCNVTHACFDNRRLVTNYPRGERELRNVFSRFSTADAVDWFQQRGVELITQDDGRMFPVTDQSQTIIDCLLREAHAAGVEIRTETEVKRAVPLPDGGFVLPLGESDELRCDKLVVATGGSPRPEAYAWLHELGHTILPPVPSLFTFNLPGDPITQLMGVAVPRTKVRIVGTSIETDGPLLVTHWGLSGPAVLKASAWGARQLSDFHYEFTAEVNWLPDRSPEQLRAEVAGCRGTQGAAQLASRPLFDLPKRLWLHLLGKAQLPHELRWGELSKKHSAALLLVLQRDEYHVRGKTTFKEEFVTCGGVSLKEIDLPTMQSKLVPGLYFAGEVIDVDGVTGGFNFQNAWSTAWLAARHIARAEANSG